MKGFLYDKNETLRVFKTLRVWFKINLMPAALFLFR